MGVLESWTGAQCGWAPNPPATSNTHLHPQWSQCCHQTPNTLFVPIPCWPEYLHSLPASHASLTPYTPSQLPIPPDGSLIPLHLLRTPDTTDTHAGTSLPTLPASPQCTPDTPTCLIMPPIPLLAPQYLHSLPVPKCTPNTPYTPDGPNTP